MTKMRTLAVRSIRAHPTRFVATVLAVVVSTGFLAGTLVLRDSLTASLDAAARNQLLGVDAAVLNEGGAVAAPAGETTGGSTPPAAPGAGGPASTRRSGGANATAGGASGRPRQLGVDQSVPAALVDELRTAPGVQDAAGVLRGFISVLRSDRSAIAENVSGSVWLAPEKLNPYRVVEGRAPQQAGEVAIDARTVEEGSLSLGTRVPLATPQGPREATLVGVTNFGEVPASAQGDVLMTEQDGFDWLLGGRPAFNAIYVTAQPGTSPDALVTAVRAAAGPGFTVETGDRLRESATTELGEVVNVIGAALVGFALVALFVALFTIYNTFSIVVHQRTREFSLLRALGASSTQVKRSVRVEAAVLGLVSSVIGFGVGVLLFEVITRLVPQFRDVVGAVSLKITVLSVLLVLLCGTLVTVVSAVIPGWRASRARPVEALRDLAIDRSGTSRARAILGLACLGLGAFLLVLGALIQQFLVMAAGPPLLFVGVLIGGPVLASAFGKVIEAVVKPFGNATLDLGVENVRRNPRRAAATALALVIGVFLVVLVTAGGGAVRDYAVTQLGQLGGPDVMVISGSGELPPEFVQQVRSADGVAAAAEVYFGSAELGDDLEGLPVSAVDYRDLPGVGLSYVSGDPARLGPTDLIMPELFATQLRLAIGDTVNVVFNSGEVRQARIGAISRTSFPPFAYISEEMALEADPALVPFSLQVMAESGRLQDVTNEVTGLSRSYAGLEVTPGNFFANVIKGFFNFVIAAASGLLTIAVVIALFGIVNTLVLSVSERRREIGLLRAVGMTRRQVRTTIRLESVAVSLLGALIGTGFGLFVAWCLTRPILNQEGEVATGFSWPVTQLVIILVLAIVVGVAASIPPARRAARLNIIEAVTVE